MPWPSVPTYWAAGSVGAVITSCSPVLTKPLWQAVFRNTSSQCSRPSSPSSLLLLSRVLSRKEFLSKHTASSSPFGEYSFTIRFAIGYGLLTDSCLILVRAEPSTLPEEQ